MFKTQLLLLGRHREVLDGAERLLKHEPGLFESHRAMAAVQIANQDYAAASSSLERVVIATRGELVWDEYPADFVASPEGRKLIIWDRNPRK